MSNVDQIDVYYNNVNGLITKKDSLNHIIQMKLPDIVALCETKLHTNSKLEINGYQTLKSNLKAGKEGIIVAVRHGTFNSAEWVFESESKQIATAEIQYPEESIRVIVVHGPQEDASIEEKEDFFNDISAEVERCLSSGKRLMIMGDFNAKLDIIDEKKSSGNGKRMKKMIDKYELKVLNFDPETEGKWTRIQRKEGVEHRSQIDYIITDTTTQQKTAETTIDEEKMYTPFRTKKCGSDKSVVFSDHCAITTKLNITKGSTRRKSSGEKLKYWIITDEGMQKYCEITSCDVGLGDMTTYDEPYDTWKNKVDELMRLCFKKKTVNKGVNQEIKPSYVSRKIRELFREIEKLGKLQREIVKEYKEKLIGKEASNMEKQKAINLKRTVSSLTTDDKLSPNAFWKMRKSLNKNPSLKLRAVTRKNGEVTYDEDIIKEEVGKEFEFRLRNREPVEGWQGYVDAVNSTVEELLKQTKDTSPAFTPKELDDAISKMKKGTSPDYYGMIVEVIANAGEGILKPLLQVLNIIKSSCKIPETWRNVLITMIYKNKGSYMDLEKYRGIFLTVIVSKLFERMLQNRIKPNLDGVSLFQAGSRKGKSGADNLFLLRSAIDYSKYMDKCLYITTYDFRQAFDSLWLQDTILVLKKLGVDSHLLKLIYEMNRKATVQVKTPYGLTKPIEVNDIVKQGGILGSPMCSAVTGEYCGRNKGVTMGETSIASLAFVDDIADLSDYFGDVIISHQNAIKFAREKKLQFAPDKCYIMVIKQKGKTNDVPTLYIDGEEIAEVRAIKYLGDIFNSLGNNDDLVADRIKRGIAAMVSIMGFMRETMLGPHTLGVYLLLHNAIFLPSMLFNAEAWSNISDKHIKELTTIQLRFLKKMMTARPSVCNAFVYLELGVLPIEFEIHKRQLSFLHHIMNLSENDPVKKVWRNQVRLPDHRNWWTSVKELLNRYSLNLSEEEITEMSKETFKGVVKKAVKEYAFQKLKDECKVKSKTKNVNYEKFVAQEYIKKLNPAMARVIFKCRSKTLNIKEHTMYNNNHQTCRWCGVTDETLEHVVNCGSEEMIMNVDELLNEPVNNDSIETIARRVMHFLSRVDV